MLQVSKKSVHRHWWFALRTLHIHFSSLTRNLVFPKNKNHLSSFLPSFILVETPKPWVQRSTCSGKSINAYWTVKGMDACLRFMGLKVSERWVSGWQGKVDAFFCKVKSISMEVVHGPNPRPESEPRVTLQPQRKGQWKILPDKNKYDTKSTYPCREKETCTWPSNWSHCMLSGQRENFQAPEQKTLNIMMGWVQLSPLSSYSTAGRKMATRVKCKCKVALNSSWRGPACFNTVYGEAFPEHLTNVAKCLGTAGWRGEAAHQFLICFSIWAALSFGHVNSTCLPVDE